MTIDMLSRRRARFSLPFLNKSIKIKKGGAAGAGAEKELLLDARRARRLLNI